MTACADCGTERPDARPRRQDGGWCAGCIAWLYGGFDVDCYRDAVTSQDFADTYGADVADRVRTMLGVA